MTFAEIALSAAEVAAGVVREGYARSHVQTVKEGIDFATDTDTRAEEAILTVLRQHCPDHGVLAEEGGWTGDRGARFTWLVDPLCGTMNFTAGVPLFCVNIALLEDGELVLGAQAEPLSREVLLAERGLGAYLLDEAGRKERVTPSATSRLLILDFGSTPDITAMEKEEPGLLRWLATRGLTSERFAARILGTSLSSGYIARGRLAAGVMLRADAVHHAAGALICREAGCIVRDLEGREWTPRSNHCVIAADRVTYEEVREILGTFC